MCGRGRRGELGGESSALAPLSRCLTPNPCHQERWAASTAALTTAQRRPLTLPTPPPLPPRLPIRPPPMRRSALVSTLRWSRRGNETSKPIKPANETNKPIKSANETNQPVKSTHKISVGDAHSRVNARFLTHAVERLVAQNVSQTIERPAPPGRSRDVAVHTSAGFCAPARRLSPRSCGAFRRDPAPARTPRIGPAGLSSSAGRWAGRPARRPASCLDGCVLRQACARHTSACCISMKKKHSPVRSERRVASLRRQAGPAAGLSGPPGPGGHRCRAWSYFPARHSDSASARPPGPPGSAPPLLSPSAPPPLCPPLARA